MSQLKPTVKISGQTVPRFFYGTAWKKNNTETLVLQALKAGFRGIDTANQRKHYYEKGAGNGLKKFLDLGLATRAEIFLQTKFTYAFGQDHRKPFDENAPIGQQVTDSFESSLEHLQTTYLDSFVLHGPYSAGGIVAEDLEAWGAMEDLHQQKLVKFLGVSNINAKQLKKLCQKLSAPPSFVQNRCFAESGWDQEVREICAVEGIAYQGFSLLTVNLKFLSNTYVSSLMKKYKKSMAQIVFRFCQQLKIHTLTGTTDAKHMREDLQIYDFELSRGEILKMQRLAFDGHELSL